MKELKYHSAYLIILLLLISCSESKEDKARRIEKEKIEKQMDKTEVKVYRALKVALRSVSTTNSDKKFNDAREVLLVLTGDALNFGINSSKGEARGINPFQLFSLAGKIYKAADVLIKEDEDNFPTLLENINYLFQGKKQDGFLKQLPFQYGNCTEHLLLGILWQSTPTAPQEISTYEFYKTNDQQEENASILLLAMYSKSIVFHKNEYYYHAYDASARSLQVLESEKKEFLKSPLIKFSNELPISPEQSYYQMHGLALLLHALNERKIDKQEEAEEHMNEFLSDAAKGGLENELTWLIGAYVAIKNENMEEAKTFLNKLKQSENISNTEVKAIDEVEVYLNKRQSGSALTVIFEKLEVTKIVGKIVAAKLNETVFFRNFSKVKEGEKLISLQQQLHSKAEQLKSLKSGVNTDSLLNSANNFLRGIFDH